MTPKERMKIPRQPMPQRESGVRRADFCEVNCGFAAPAAQREADRCLGCPSARCVEGCPVGVDVPAFLQAVSAGDLAAAAQILFRGNPLPGITGRVCPQEVQCEGVCVRAKGHGAPVAIGHLERFVADWARENGALAPPPPAAPSGRAVAIVGAGPAGLTAAGELVQRGHRVVVFEALHAPGGVLRYGIPEFRLPREIIDAEVDRLRRAGVEIQTNVVIGRTFTLDELLTREGFDAVFIANGAGLPIFMNIPGENLKGVYSANEFLTRVNLMGANRFPACDTPVLRGERAVVVGGGNTAMDSVRTALRLGAREATLVYRRGRAEMPARVEEIVHAEEEGVRFELLANPVEILGDASRRVAGVRCVRMELGPPDASGRRRPIEIPGSAFEIAADVVIEALGTRANPLLAATAPDLPHSARGYIEVDEHGQTRKPGVFAGGDIVRGAATVILAMGDGKRAGRAIDRYLCESAEAKQTHAASTRALSDSQCRG